MLMHVVSTAISCSPCMLAAVSSHRTLAAGEGFPPGAGREMPDVLFKEPVCDSSKWTWNLLRTLRRGVKMVSLGLPSAGVWLK